MILMYLDTYKRSDWQGYYPQSKVTLSDIIQYEILPNIIGSMCTYEIQLSFPHTIDVKNSAIRGRVFIEVLRLIDGDCRS